MNVVWRRDLGCPPHDLDCKGNAGMLLSGSRPWQCARAGGEAQGCRVDWLRGRDARESLGCVLTRRSGRRV